MANEYLKTCVKDAKSLAPEALGIFTGFSVIFGLLFFIHLIKTDPKIETGDYIQIIISVILSLTLIFSIFSQRQNHRFEQSRAYLDSSIALINKAYEVLSTKNTTPTNDRICWVTAARLINRAMNISKLISVEAHTRIFESEHDYQRHRFSNLLKINNKEIPAEYFLGKNYVPNDIGQSAFNNICRGLCDEWIPEAMIAEIYRFKSFPEDYEDPLNSSNKFNMKELNRIWIFGQTELYKYVIFRRLFCSISGNIYQRNPSKKTTPMEINQSINSISKFDPEINKQYLE